VVAPLVLAGAVGAGLLTGSTEAFRTVLGAGAAIWGLSVLGEASRRRPGEPEDVFGGRRHILAEIEAGLEEAARRLLESGDRGVRRGRAFRPRVESGYEPGE